MASRVVMALMTEDDAYYVLTERCYAKSVMDALPRSGNKTKTLVLYDDARGSEPTVSVIVECFTAPDEGIVW